MTLRHSADRSAMPRGVRSGAGVLCLPPSPAHVADAPTQDTICHPPQNPSYAIDGKTHQTPYTSENAGALNRTLAWPSTKTTPAATALQTGLKALFGAVI
jgi:hypothetical protein